jgi:hypothetical protein
LNNMDCKIPYFFNFLLCPSFAAHGNFQVWLTFLNFSRLKSDGRRKGILFSQ